MAYDEAETVSKVMFSIYIRASDAVFGQRHL